MDKFGKKSIIISFLYLLLFGSLLYFVSYPALNNLKKSKIEYDKKQQILRGNDDKLGSFQKIEKNPKEFEQLYTAVAELWPDNQDVSKFIVQIESLAKNSNLVIENFSVEQTNVKAKPKDDTGNEDSASSDKKQTGGTQFTLVVKSPYSNLVDLMTKMETMARLNSISSVDMNLLDETNISLKITGTIYNGK